MSETFVTVARFQYSSEAQIIKGRLEADGIDRSTVLKWNQNIGPCILLLRQDQIPYASFYHYNSSKSNSINTMPSTTTQPLSFVIGMEIIVDRGLEEALDGCSIFDASDGDGLSFRHSHSRPEEDDSSA